MPFKSIFDHSEMNGGKPNNNVPQFCLKSVMYEKYVSPAGKGLTSWLSLVLSDCEFVTFPLASWVRCVT